MKYAQKYSSAEENWGNGTVLRRREGEKIYSWERECSERTSPEKKKRRERDGRWVKERVNGGSGGP